MKLAKVIMMICLAALPMWANGQMHEHDSDTTRIMIEDGWIEKMNRFLTLKLGINSKIETFRVDSDPNRLVLYPNANTNIRVSASYRFLSFGINFKPGFLPGNGDIDLKGETELSRIRLNFNFRHWIQGVSYSRIKGFFLENTRDYFDDWEEDDPHIKFPDLRFLAFGGHTAYKFNPKFSLKSIVTQSERQLRSAGTLIARARYRYYSTNDLSDPQPGGSKQKSANLEFDLGMGYHYTFVAREKFFISLGAGPSIGYIRTRLTTSFPADTFISFQNNIPIRWDLTGGIGFQGKRFYADLFFDASGTTFREQGTTAVNTDTLIFYQFTLGWRIPVS